MKLANKFAIITGASTGIGREIASALAKESVLVGLVARRKEKLAETKKLIERFGGKAIEFQADLSNLKSVNNLTIQIKKQTKKVNILINVAGLWHGKSEVYAGMDFDKFSQQLILDTYFVGLVSPTLIAHSLIALMPKGSKIINISGTFESGAKGWLPYYVSKRGIEDLTVALAQDLKEKGIQVNAVSPSDTATEEYKKYFPQYIQDAIDPSLVADRVVHILKQNITGEVIVVKKNKKPFKGFHF